MAKGGSSAMKRWLWLAAAIVAVDQLTKFAILRSFSFGERLAVVPGLFDLTLVFNRGAAFSYSRAGGCSQFNRIAPRAGGRGGYAGDSILGVVVTGGLGHLSAAAAIQWLAAGGLSHGWHQYVSG